MSTRSSRITALLAGTAALSLALTGCLNLGFNLGGGDSTTKPTGEEVEPGLEHYYTQVLTWTSCGGGAECTTAIAPMNWDDPAAGDIELALTRHPARGAKLGSLFVNPGGPGASGFDFVHDDPDWAVGPSLRQRFDIVGWDPRGVGRSTPVTCVSDAELDDFIYGIPDAPVDSQEWIDEVTESSIAFGQACLQNTGPSLEFIDTVSTVRDLDMMRAVLGDEKLHYLGYSYGSDIGAYYIDLFPQKVGRIVVDGATDPSISVFEVGLTQTAGFQLALENYLDACHELFGADCPFLGEKTADLATIRALYDRYDANPIPHHDGRMMDAGVIDIAMSMALYSPDSWFLLNDLFEEAELGLTDTAFYLADYYYSRGDDGRYLDNSLEAFIAIYCVDYPVETDPAVLEQQQEQLREASPTTFRDLPAIGDVTCANWPYQYRGSGIGTVSGDDAPPVLVISTTGDPATPYEWGVALAQQLSNARLITYNGEGHTAYNKSNDCIQDAVDDYFIDGTVPAADPDC